MFLTELSRKRLLSLAVVLISVNCFATRVQDECPGAPPVANGSPSIRVTTSEELRDAIHGLTSGGRRHIVIAPGEYRVLQGAYPIHTSNVTIRGETGLRDDVIVRGAGMTGRTRHVFSISAPYFTLRDLTLGWVAHHAVQVRGEHDADYARFMNLRFVNTREQMLKVSADHSMPDGEKVGADHGVVSHSVFEFPSGVAQQHYTGGIDAHFAANWRIHDNTFRNIRSPEKRLAEHAIHFWRGSSNTIVELNMIFNADRGIGFSLGQDGAGHRGGLVRNNFVHVTRDVGIGLESSSGARVVHNSVFVDSPYANAIEYRFPRTQDVCHRA